MDLPDIFLNILMGRRDMARVVEFDVLNLCLAPLPPKQRHNYPTCGEGSV